VPAAGAGADPSRIERLAVRYVPGRGPVAIGRLGSGLVNRSYRVARDGREYSLRAAAPRDNAIGLGLDRAWECRVLRRAARAGLAPHVERCEPRAGVLVARWVEGSCWSTRDASSVGVIEKVALLARRVQALSPMPRPRIVSAAQWIDFYRRELDGHGDETTRGPRDPGLRDIDRRARSLLESLTREPAPAGALCHGDLHVQNLVIVPGGDPVILDWEYAHVADPWWDLAGWACNGDLTPDRRDLLLGFYLGRAPAAGETARLARLAWLYDYVCLLWCELYPISRSSAGEPVQVVSARAGQLAERLRRCP
jgi:aminoglycoside phosphotransferase (APT) family kinase protein